MAVLKFRDPVTGAECIVGAPTHEGLVYSGVIGTSWETNSSTGVKTQTVIVPGMSAEWDVNLDHVYTGNDSIDSYNEFIEAENQFLNYITNGFARTINGGILFTIFGDANTVEIPFVAGVI